MNKTAATEPTPLAIEMRVMDAEHKTDSSAAAVAAAAKRSLAEELAEQDQYLLPQEHVTRIVPPSVAGDTVLQKWSRVSNRRKSLILCCCASMCLLFGGIVIIIGTLADALNKAKAASNPECLVPAGVVLDNLCRSAGYFPTGQNGTGELVGDVDFYTADAAWANNTAQMQKLLTYAQLMIPQPVNTTLCTDDLDACADWTLFRVTLQVRSGLQTWAGRFGLQTTELVHVGPSFSDWDMDNPQRFVYNRVAVGHFNTRAYQTLSTIGAFRIVDIGAPDDPSYLGNNRVISTWAFRNPGSSSGSADQHSLYTDIASFTIASSVYVAVAVERMRPVHPGSTNAALHHNLGVYIIDATNELNLHVISRIYENAVWLDAHSIAVYQPSVTTSLVFGRTMLGVVVRAEMTDSSTLPFADCRFYDISVVSRPISLGSWSYTQATQFVDDAAGIGYQEMSADTVNYRYMAESMAISDDLVVIAYWNFGVQVLRITQYETWKTVPTQFQLQQVAYYDDEFILKPWSDPLAQPVFTAVISAPLGSVYIADSWPACSGGVIKQLALPLPGAAGSVQRMQLQATVSGTGDTVSSLQVFTPGAPADSKQWTPAQLHSTALVVGQRRGGFRVLNATGISANGLPATIATGSDHTGDEFAYIGVVNAVAFADVEEAATTAFIAYSDRMLGLGIAAVNRWTS